MRISDELTSRSTMVFLAAFLCWAIGGIMVPARILAKLM